MCSRARLLPRTPEVVAHFYKATALVRCAIYEWTLPFPVHNDFASHGVRCLMFGVRCSVSDVSLISAFFFHFTLRWGWRRGGLEQKGKERSACFCFEKTRVKSRSSRDQRRKPILENSPFLPCYYMRFLSPSLPWLPCFHLSFYFPPSPQFVTPLAVPLPLASRPLPSVFSHPSLSDFCVQFPL